MTHESLSEATELTTERLQEVLTKIEPLVAQGLMGANLYPPKSKVFILRKKSEGKISYFDITPHHGWQERQTDEFQAAYLSIGRGACSGVDGLHPAVEASKERSESADRMLRTPLRELDITVGDSP